MTWCGWLCAGLLTLAAVSAADRTDARSEVMAEYAVRYGPLTILSLRVRTESGDGHYRTTTEARTVGLAGVILPWHASATTEGRVEPSGMQPVTHRSRSEYRGQWRSVAIDYGAASGVVAAIQPPAADDDRDAVPVALQQETVDPLTATLSALASNCRGTVRVFDGRRRYDLQLADLGEVEVPRSLDTIYTGRARVCRGEMQPIAGFWGTGPQHDERPSRLDSWIAAPRPDLPAVPVYLELSNQRGMLSVHLTRVSAGPSSSAQ